MSDFDQGDAARIAVIGDFDQADEIVNVWEVQVGNASIQNEADVLDAIVEFVEALYTLISALQTLESVWRRIHVNQLSGTGTPLFRGDLLLQNPIPGQGTGDPGAPGVAALMWSNISALPHSQVRKYLGPMSEALLNQNGNFGGNFVSDMNAIVTFLASNFVATNSVSLGWCLQSSVDGQVYPVSDAISYTIVPAYRRSRKQGSGS